MKLLSCKVKRELVYLIKYYITFEIYGIQGDDQMAESSKDESQYKVLKTGDVYLVNRKRNALRYYLKGDASKRPYVNIAGSKRQLARVILERFKPILAVRNFVAANIDGNVDNCNVSNLKWVPRSNIIKGHKMGHKRGASAYGDKWVATITERGRTTHLGTFAIKERAYDAFYIEYKKRNGVAPW